MDNSGSGRLNPMGSNEFSLSKSNRANSFKRNVGVDKKNNIDQYKNDKSIIKKIGSYFSKK